MDFIIWDSHLDLSPKGVEDFCKTHAADFNKTPDELKALSLMDLAVKYMWSFRAAQLRSVKETLNHKTGTPIVVFSDVVDFLKRKTECTLLDGENLRDIFQCRHGSVTKFYTDGQDLRCDNITEDGTNYHIFRAVKDPKALGICAKICKEENRFPTKSELDQCTVSLAPLIDRLFGKEVPNRFEKHMEKKGKRRQVEYQR